MGTIDTRLRRRKKDEEETKFEEVKGVGVENRKNTVGDLRGLSKIMHSILVRLRRSLNFESCLSKHAGLSHVERLAKRHFLFTIKASGCMWTEYAVFITSAYFE